MAENDQNGELNRPHCNERYIDAVRLIEPCFAHHEQMRHRRVVRRHGGHVAARQEHQRAGSAVTPIMKLLVALETFSGMCIR
jgi:hypothetical protein